ncbi:hypothetical protein ANCCEY_15692 [Ancylostoma ceylanicum]|uniref:Uncharacterized protein n=1 Tax=Ancylostoma ceylanicum TaxID=53326 RepID=A0A0D6L3E0_9BILA|nr:hypothetical protein ANCCEY_15692 [Ancylostoma ceylanicum]
MAVLAPKHSTRTGLPPLNKTRRMLARTLTKRSRMTLARKIPRRKRSPHLLISRKRDQRRQSEREENAGIAMIYANFGHPSENARRTRTGWRITVQCRALSVMEPWHASTVIVCAISGQRSRNARRTPSGCCPTVPKRAKRAKVRLHPPLSLLFSQWKGI